jgi:outer membrane protein OmpA-like peptidoglycan-associated protein
MDASSVDILLGVKHRLRRNLNLDYGGTFEPGVDSLSPRYRVFAGLVYYFNVNSPSRTPPPPPAKIEEKSAPRLAPLIIYPETAEVTAGTSVTIQARGGEPPYAFRLARGQGRLYPDTGTYRTALTSETAEIEVSDHAQQVKVARITSKPAPKPDEIIRLRRLNFVFNTDVLIESSRIDILRTVEILRGRKIKRIIVEGHTDSIGSDEFNIELSERRARAISRVLIRELNLPEGVVENIGYGERVPIANNNTEIGRALNRRADIKVYWQ